MVGCGHAFEAAIPLPFLGFSTGLRADFVQPPWGGPLDVGVGFPYRGSDYWWLTWALALKLGDTASFGMSLEHAYSANPYVDNPHRGQCRALVAPEQSLRLLCGRA